MKRSPLILTASVITLTAFACVANAQTPTPLNLIGGADSGAVIPNGDLENLIPFRAPDVEVDFTVGNGGFGSAANLPRSFEPGSRTVELSDLEQIFIDAELDPTTLDNPIDQLNVQNGLDFVFLAIPGFRLDRVGDLASQGGGNAVFGFDTSTGTPLDGTFDDGMGGTLNNTSAFSNNGILALSTDGGIDVGANVGAGTTFTLSFDVSVDGNGGNDLINFTPTLSITNGAGLVVEVVGETPTLDDDNGGAFTINGSTITGDGAELLARVTQEFTVPDNIAAQQVSLSIEFGEGVSRSAVDRGTIDNIELTGELIEAPTEFGDFNNDGVISAADFTVFRDSAGGSDDALLSNAGINDGTVDNLDFDVFVANFDAAPAVGGLVGAATVPEPSSLLVLLLGVATLAAKPSRR